MSAMSSLEGELVDFMAIMEEGRKEVMVDHSTEPRVLEPARLVLVSSPLGGEEDIWNYLVTNYNSITTTFRI